MKFRLTSDVHTEFFNKKIEESDVDIILTPHSDDSVSTLILAGDIGKLKTKQTIMSFLNLVCDRFKEVILVLGNHEYYGSNYGTVLSKFSTDIPDNLIILDDDVHVIGDTRILGSTLWTNCNRRNPIDMGNISNTMNDFNNIRIGTATEPWKRTFNINDMINCFDKHVKFLERKLAEHHHGDTIVITHHAPSFKSITAQYMSSKVNAAYASDLSELILDNDITLWCHGHTHDSSDYMIGDTRVVTNPRGYPRRNGVPENKDYDSSMYFEFD